MFRDGFLSRTISTNRGYYEKITFDNDVSDKNYEVDLEKISSAEGIFPNMNKQIAANIYGTIACADEYVVEVDNTENLTFNGWHIV